jgi:hypothetical protein
MATYEATTERPPAWLSRALFSGFIATVAMMVALLVAYGLAYLLSAQPPAGADSASRAEMAQWFQGLVHNPLVDLTQANLYFAIGLHFAIGLVWAVIYAAFFEPRLWGPGWQRGAIFSLLPWLLSLLIFLPLTGGGFLGMDMNAGPLPILGNFLLNLAYGATLGAVYGPFGDVLFSVDSAEEGMSAEDDLRAIAASDRAAARGMLIGLIAGVVLGFLGAVIIQPAAGALFLGASQLAIFFGTALIGCTIGALVGSMMEVPLRQSAAGAEPATRHTPVAR